MIDLKYIKDNSGEVKRMLIRRGVEVDIDALIASDDERLRVLSEVENLRALRNQVSKEDTPENRERGAEIKNQLKELEARYKQLADDVRDLHERVPNLLHPDVPDGVSDDDNTEVRKWGEPPALDFEPKDHEQIAQDLGLIDIESGSKVSGSGFYYLTGDLVLLELALTKYVMELMQKEGFVPVITPELVRKRLAKGTGYIPKRGEPDIYKIENEDLYLVATAEIPLAGIHMDEILEESELPKKYVGFSTCFRKESGTYGKHKKGIFRMHQFDKVEMFALVKEEDSMATFHKFIELSEKIMRELELPYRVTSACAGEMNGPGYIKYDLEYYSPVDGEYRELTSGTNTTDYQARRLNIRYKTKEGDKKYVHTLNNTAFAFSRGLIAIIENNQQADGSVRIPKVLQPYLGKDVIR